MAASNTRFTQNSLGQSKTPIDSDHGIYRKPKTADRDRESADMREYDLVHRPIRPADLP